jgi:hypothetical protein
MEGNKIIAEFMGAKPLVLGGSTEYEMYGVIDCIEDGVNEKHYFIDDEMRFHSSWDWLKKVVDEIEMRCQGVPQELLHLSLFSPRQEVYKAVVEFIKNQNQIR